jgi:homoserine dehydrogenase
MFYGRGAGGLPTASAVLGDLISAARNRVGGSRGPGESSYAELPLRAMGQVITRYHISLDVEDRPGVLAQVSKVIAEHGVSIETVRQQRVPAAEPAAGEDVHESEPHRSSLVVVTHSAPDAALAATVQALAKLDVVAAVVGVMRVEGED